MNKVRCAVYTRKSSEEGLEQSFNSLHAQHEACAAYVLSQASEGWTLIPEKYDDGGLSGGTLKRPALQRLLADIAQGKVDIVVVYKVDRLTRSLLDFAKLVEAFDKAGTSFVSITQSFNTTTSMGRLTLNMLLSFAQFEREVTAERIRDKLAASKARGMWMGGIPPIGYRGEGRTLAIVEEHAQFVRDIFARYLRLGNVRLVADQLAGEGIVSPQRQCGTGRSSGGTLLTRGQIYYMLNNPVYRGLIRHRNKTYPGLHPAIIDEATWEQVQTRLAEQTQGTSKVRAARPSLLAGLAFDEAGDPLLAVHASKLVTDREGPGRHRYRYYVSRGLQRGDGAGNHGVRIPARELESEVVALLIHALSDPLKLLVSEGMQPDASTLSRATELADALSAKLRERCAETMRMLIQSVKVLPHKLQVELQSGELAAALGATPEQHSLAEPLVLSAPIRLTRTGRVVRMVQQDGKRAAGREPDAALVKLLAKSHSLWARIEGGEISIAELSREMGMNDSYATRLVRLAFLSPEIVSAIVRGEQPAGVNAIRLLNTPIAASWRVQEQSLGFG